MKKHGSIPLPTDDGTPHVTPGEWVTNLHYDDADVLAELRAGTSYLLATSWPRATALHGVESLVKMGMVGVYRTAARRVVRSYKSEILEIQVRPVGNRRKFQPMFRGSVGMVLIHLGAYANAYNVCRTLDRNGKVIDYWDGQRFTRLDGKRTKQG